MHDCSEVLHVLASQLWYASSEILASLHRQMSFFCAIYDNSVLFQLIH
jgi:hypothetical protein